MLSGNEKGLLSSYDFFNGDKSFHIIKLLKTLTVFITHDVAFSCLQSLQRKDTNVWPLISNETHNEKNIQLRNQNVIVTLLE